MRKILLSVLLAIAPCGWANDQVGETVSNAEVQTVPAPAKLNDAAAYLSAHVGAVVALAPDADAKVLPTATLALDAPLSLGKRVMLRGYLELELSSSPGEAIDVTTPEGVATFRTGGANIGSYFVIGESQNITTAIVAEWGFRSRATTNEVHPQERLVRHYGGGLRVGSRDGAAFASVLYGRNEECGPRNWGQWTVKARVPIPSTQGLAVLGIDASLNAGPSDESSLALAADGTPTSLAQRPQDVLRARVMISLDQALAKLKGKS